MQRCSHCQTVTHNEPENYWNGTDRSRVMVKICVVSNGVICGASPGPTSFSFCRTRGHRQDIQPMGEYWPLVTMLQVRSGCGILLLAKYQNSSRRTRQVVGIWLFHQTAKLWRLRRERSQISSCGT